MTSQALADLIAEIGPDKIWRPVHDPDGNLLAAGAGCPEDGFDQDHGLDFTGKSVADLGCNLGQFSLQAAGQGAAVVHGFDRDPRLCRGATLLARMHGQPNVGFFARDFIGIPPPRQYDMAVLVDVIGKKHVAEGMLLKILDAAQRFSAREIVMTVRPRYRVKKDLHTTPEALEHDYGPGLVHGRYFLVLRCVARHMAPHWATDPLPHRLGIERKIPIRFIPAGDHRPGGPT